LDKRPALATPLDGRAQQAEAPRPSGEYLADRPPAGGGGPAPAVAGVRLLETRYCTLDLDEERALVRFVRSALPYATVADIDQDGTEIDLALEKVGRARLLADLRAAVARDDPGFERAMVRFRRKLFGGGGRMAILVRTAVGALQVKRHLREDGLVVEVFSTEDAALAFFDARSDGQGCGSGPFHLR